MAMKKILMVAGAILIAGGVSAGLENATYTRLFGNAQVLLPGVTIIERDAFTDGEWEVTGGKLIERPAGAVLEAQSERVELVWRGSFPKSQDQALRLELTLSSDIQLRAMFNGYSDGKFKRVGGWMVVEPDTASNLRVDIHTPPNRRYGDAMAGVFDGFKIVLEGKELAGQIVEFNKMYLKAEYSEGYFRHEIEIPAGEIWDAVAEVGLLTSLYVNGQRVDDESVIMSRPNGRNRSLSRRVPLGDFLKPGRNVLGMHVFFQRGVAPAYMSGAVVMADGTVVRLDSGTNWVWRREAPANWYMPDYKDGGWQGIVNIDDTPRSAGREYHYKGTEAAASQPVHMGLNYRSRGNWPAYAGLIKLRNPLDNKLYFNENKNFLLKIFIPSGFKDKNPELAWEIHRYDGTDAGEDQQFTEIAQGRVADFVPCRAFARETPSVAGGSESWSPRSQGEGGSDRDRRSRLQVEGEAVPSRDAGSPQVRPPEKLELNVSSAEGSAESLAGEINSVKLDRGIYVFTSRLLLNGEVVEERDPEAMVVVGKIEMPEQTAGDFWEQNMELKIERVIDFTNPDDPHSCFETDSKGPIPRGKWGTNFYHTVEPALIVERNGLKYRETRPVSRAQFSYFIEEFAHPGDWYLMVLEYPDDAERCIGVSCNADSRVMPLHARAKPEEIHGDATKCGPSIWTGGKYPNSGEMLEMKWLYRPDPGGHAVNVMSLMHGRTAAAARLRIYHIAGRLPELDAGTLPLREQRRFGMLTERTSTWCSGIFNFFSSFEKGSVPNLQRGFRGAGRYSKNAVVDLCEHLRMKQDAATHYAEYMRFTGHNIHAMSCFQYSDNNTAAQYVTRGPRIHESPENMLARVLQANDLMFYASVQFTSTDKMGDIWTPEWFFADREGNRRINMWAGNPLNFNFLHPEVEGEMLKFARQLAEKFQYQPNFLGINWLFGGFRLPGYRMHTYPPNPEDDPMQYGYDDLTISLFEKDTGIVVGSQKSEVRSQNEEDPDRYEQRYQFLTSPEMKPIWLAWRSEKTAEFFVKLQREISAVRPGLEVVAGTILSHWHFEEWQAQNVGFADYMDQWGLNPAAFEGKENVWMMPWLHAASRDSRFGRDSDTATWEGSSNPEFYRPLAQLSRRAIMLATAAIEVERIAANFPAQEGWPRSYQQTMMGQAREEMAMAPYTQAMIGFDAQMFMTGFGDLSPYIGVEEMQRKFTRVLRRLPMGKFEPVLDTGFDANFAIRALRVDNELYFYVANPGYWPISGTIKLENAEQVIELVSNQSVPLDNGAIKVSLEPFGIAGFRASPSEISNLKSEISNWSTDPLPDSELVHMRDIIARAQTEAAHPDMPAFLGSDDYAVLAGTVTAADKALEEGRYAAAWAGLTDEVFWTILSHKTPEIKYYAITRPRALTAVAIPSDQVPVIDGALDDHVWQDEVTVGNGDFVARTKEYSGLTTILRVARTGNRLFIAVECQDPDPRRVRGTTDITDAQNTIWSSRDDLLAIFIMPESDTPEERNYFQLAVTANGARFEQHSRIRHGIMTERNNDYVPEWQVVTGRNEQGWTLEAEIDTVKAFGVPLREGAEWKLNVHRQFRLNRYPVSSWSFNSGDWHAMEYMGVVNVE